MNNCLTQYYRCPEHYVRLAAKGALSETSGYFRFGEEVCYGSCSGHRPSGSPQDALWDASHDTTVEEGTICLPFDLDQVVTNLRCEVFADDWRSGSAKAALSRIYYFIRPVLPVGVRKHLQKLHLKGWDKLPFPHWPVDRTVDNLFERFLLLSLRSQRVERIPFVWFWPEGASSCAIMTHDVETTLGRNFCPTLMDIDDSFGIKASFQVIPEERYDVTPSFLKSIREGGFEVVIHDLNHDGHLFRDRQQFLKRAAKINSYGEQYGAVGFRAGVLYRKQLWYEALNFAYDMSVPNVAHLDPQHGGCCTVMPYFIGKILELPVTATQDYTLFHMLNEYSIDLWKRQIELVMEKHGLISFVVHPDYLTSSRERSTYEALLAHLVQLRKEQDLWIATPGEVNGWWRQRAEMRIVEEGKELRIEGSGKERARIAYASEKDGRLVVTVQATADEKPQSIAVEPR